MVAGSEGPKLARVVRFFRRHPALLLFGLTPGIPEYLSGSTSTALLAVNPLGFLVFLALNLALYGPGVLLVREAWIRFGRGWAALLCLGTAYGLLEEGTALSTLFDPAARVVGTEGSYGRFAGVNWVWTAGVLPVHVLFSVGLPLLLLGLAVPATRGVSLLSRQEVVAAAGVYVLDIVLFASITHYYSVQPAEVVGAAVVALGFWGVASRLPPRLLGPTAERPSHGPRVFFLLGLVFYPVLVLIPGAGEATRLPAALSVAGELVALAVLFFLVRRWIGRTSNEPQWVAFAFGTTLPLAVVGLVAQLALPVELAVDAVYAAFFSTLWVHYRVRPGGAPVPAKALG